MLMLLFVGLFGAAASAAVNDPAPTAPSGTAGVSTDPTAGVDTTQTLIQDKQTADTQRDNEITNANDTGKGVGTNDGTTRDGVIKSHDMVKNDGTTGTQRTHGEYQNNTNSCASCHQTHTGSAKNLLMKDGVYSTCTACHDGTLGFYNVYEGSTAGTFGATADHDGSLHMANDSLTVSAAPGGDRTGTDEKSWGKEFNCASCHSPHGSYSDRLLNYNPNDMGATASQKGGNAATSKIYAFADIATIKADVATKLAADANYNPKNDYGKFILVKGTLGDFGITPDSGNDATTVAITSYGFSLDHGVYSLTLANAPILDIHEYQSAPKKSVYAAKLFNLTDPNTDANTDGIADELDTLVFPYVGGDATDLKTYDQNDGTAVMNIHFQKGYITGTAVDTANYGSVARAYVVKLDLVPYADVAASEFAPGGQFSYVSSQNVNTTDWGGIKPLFSYDKSLYNSKDHTGAAFKGNGIAVNNYCAACHTDYLATSEKETGTFTKAYRHTTEVDTYACVRCHYAHGTSRDIMKDAQGRTIADLTDATYMGANVMTADQANAWMDDKNSSSALKKFTNMAGCWSCHNSSHNEQLVNNNNTTPAQQAINGGWKNE